MTCPVAIVRAVAAKVIVLVCVVESHVSPTLASATHGALTWLLSVVIPA